MCCTKWSSVVNLDLFWKQVFSYNKFVNIYTNLQPAKVSEDNMQHEMSEHLKCL